MLKKISKGNYKTYDNRYRIFDVREEFRNELSKEEFSEFYGIFWRVVIIDKHGKEDWVNDFYTLKDAKQWIQNKQKEEKHD